MGYTIGLYPINLKMDMSSISDFSSSSEVSTTITSSRVTDGENPLPRETVSMTTTSKVPEGEHPLPGETASTMTTSRVPEGEHPLPGETASLMTTSRVPEGEHPLSRESISPPPPPPPSPTQEEVDELKAKIASLEETLKVSQELNAYLRDHVSDEVLANIESVVTLKKTEMAALERNKY